MKLDMDSTVLCLACSSSIPPKHKNAYVTPCCAQVICDSCIRASPRLLTYDPCLACLGGVSAASASSSTEPFSSKAATASGRNVLPLDAPNEDEGMFVLGDDSDEDPAEQEADQCTNTKPSPPRASSPAAPPSDQKAMDGPTTANAEAPTSLPPLADTPVPARDPNSVSPSRKYYINPSDTVHGIALRLGVDARELCRLNKLPPSTLSTTPHLLHTRAFLELPPSSRPVPLQYVLTEEDQARRDTQRARERAERRLQMVTKEVDWRVAKAYVALAEEPQVIDEFANKRKEGSDKKPSSSAAALSDMSLEAIAVDMYLEDEEWEQNEATASCYSQSSQLPSRKTNPSLSEKSTKNKWGLWKSSE